jgi:hypothetical protein
MARRELRLANEGAFAVHQGDAGWFGFGVENFLPTVENQRSRYAELQWDRYHHSEELGYVDHMEGGGLFGVSLRQSTRGGNNLHSSGAEILIPGLPIDMEGIRNFCHLTRNPGASLEVVNGDPVKKRRFPTKTEVEPVASIVSDSNGQKWVSGLVIKKPLLSEGGPVC